MKNKNGISLIALIVTIIVLILISSITIYTGGNMLDQSRIRNAKDRMMTVANAIATHEEALGFADIVVGSPSGDYRLLGVDDYEIMGLTDFKNESHMPPIYVYKTVHSVDPSNPDKKTKKEYKFKTPKIVKSDEKYKEEDFVEYTHTFYDDSNRENLKIEFDTAKGVNRPLITEDMMPVRMYFNEDSTVSSNPVNNIYDENWYDYSSTSPNWANVKMNNGTYYVWIPRFAYKVEEFYRGTSLANVPSSAIKVVFLKGTTDYMSNDEVLPEGYQVHPAFKYYDKSGVKTDLPGFWIAKYNVNDMVDVVYKVAGEGANILSALDEVKLANIHSDNVGGTYTLKESIERDLSSHLLKNTEWAAVTYLSFATGGKISDGSSLQNNASAVMDLNVRQFVAGVLDGVTTVDYSELENFDRYDITADNSLEYDSLEEKQFGDAMVATSSGASINSSWFGGRSERISSSAPFIIRGVDNCIFSYSADRRDSVRGAGCRNVLLVK